MKPVKIPILLVPLIFAFVGGTSSAGLAADASDWIPGHKSEARLVAGGTQVDGTRLVLLEIKLEPGWKTYWRTPGDAGGLPPSFDWSKSDNLASADVAFPAPHRFTDRSGSTIGYKGEVALPITLKPVAADKPVPLVVGLHYGICKDICVPVEAELTLTVEPNGAVALADEVNAALSHIPKPQEKVGPDDPVLVSAKAVTEGDANVSIEARFPKGAVGADAFLEAPDGLFLPLPDLIGDIDASGKAVFEAKLGADVDLKSLKGKPITVTLVSETGASQATFVAE